MNEISMDFENMEPEQAQSLPLIDFEMLDLKSMNTLYLLYPDTYHRLQAESEAKREQAIRDRNNSFDTIRNPQPKPKPKPEVDRTRMPYNKWLEYLDRQRGIEPEQPTPTYDEWVQARMNPTTQNTYRGRHN